MTIAELHGLFLRCAGACTDTRKLLPGGMFFALKGPNFDANAFARPALDAGCRFAVIDDPAQANGPATIVVPDVLLALQQLARHHRRMFDVPVLAITGSNGKTTTKELVHAVLSTDRTTLATQGNLNNHIGVPLTLLRLTREHRAAIIEMGANKPGDIAELCAIAEPTLGLITNIGKAHLEGFGSLEGVIRTKTELYGHLRQQPGGFAFVNADDTLLLDKSAGLPRMTYGTPPTADLQGRRISDGPFLSFEFMSPAQGWQRVHTRLIGDYNLPNALAAACVGMHLGVGVSNIVRGAEGYAPSNNRSQFLDTGRNHLVLDAYNANPSSMQAALRNFAESRTDRPKLAFLGGMKELGEHSLAEHQAIADLVADLGLEALLIGPEFTGVEARGRTVFADPAAALAALTRDPVSGRSILLKGSRGTGLEVLVPAL
jgi:UDP-N-acetylmuramoyl-tripeptide--D-alanyl-D-alanine ligase